MLIFFGQFSAFRGCSLFGAVPYFNWCGAMYISYGRKDCVCSFTYSLRCWSLWLKSFSNIEIFDWAFSNKESLLTWSCVLFLDCRIVHLMVIALYTLDWYSKVLSRRLCVWLLNLSQFMKKTVEEQEPDYANLSIKVSNMLRLYVAAIVGIPIYS